MHVTLIESLRCPVPHTQSALVASASKQVERRIVQGTLGCPVCGASFSIRGGIADLRGAQARGGEPASAPPAPEPNEESVVRLAAQLDLTERGRYVVLAGEYARLAPGLTLMFDAIVLAINPPRGEERHIAQHASVVRIDAGAPLARESMHGAAVDTAEAARLGIDQVSATLRPNARLVAPGVVALPVGFSVLARDASEWVATRAAHVVQLKRSSS